MQARWGSHGDYGVIALAPSSPQEMFDLTVTAFNLSETYRLPVFVLGDEMVGHMSERVVIPPPEQIQVGCPHNVRSRPGSAISPFMAGDDLVPPMACAGDGYHVHVTGLTHDEQGYPVITAAVQERLVRRLVDKIRLNAAKIIQTEAVGPGGGRGGGGGLRLYRPGRPGGGRPVSERPGIKVGLLRLITLWPFPEEQISGIAERVKAFIVPEINYGQMVYEVERCAQGRAETGPAGAHGGRHPYPRGDRRGRRGMSA